MSRKAQQSDAANTSRPRSDVCHGPCFRRFCASIVDGLIMSGLSKPCSSVGLSSWGSQEKQSSLYCHRDGCGGFPLKNRSAISARRAASSHSSASLTGAVRLDLGEGGAAQRPARLHRAALACFGTDTSAALLELPSMRFLVAMLQNRSLTVLPDPDNSIEQSEGMMDPCIRIACRWTQIRALP